MLNVLAVGAGGFVGAALRYIIGMIHVTESLVFPIKTFMINIIGCIIIGLIAVSASRNLSMQPHIMLFLKVGLCGGFTTFSTFALETAELIKAGHATVAFLYVVLSAIVGVAVIFAVEYMTLR